MSCALVPEGGVRGVPIDKVTGGGMLVKSGASCRRGGPSLPSFPPGVQLRPPAFKHTSDETWPLSDWPALACADAWWCAAAACCCCRRRAQVCELPQSVRDEVGTLLLRVTLRELFTWRFMQVRWGLEASPTCGPVAAWHLPLACQACVPIARAAAPQGHTATRPGDHATLWPCDLAALGPWGPAARLHSHLARRPGKEATCPAVQIAGLMPRCGGLLLRAVVLRALAWWVRAQTDPNWGNFLYDHKQGVLNLIDFGAAKEYPQVKGGQGRGRSSGRLLSARGHRWNASSWAAGDGFAGMASEGLVCLRHAPPLLCSGLCGRLPAHGEGLRRARRPLGGGAVHQAGLPHR